MTIFEKRVDGIILDLKKRSFIAAENIGSDNDENENEDGSEEEI